MFDLTPAERRGVLWIAALLLIGAGRDLWTAWRPPAAPPPPRAVRVAAAPPAPLPLARMQDSVRGPAPGRTLDLNRASEADLDRLPGIGPVLARRIVERRRELGGFRRVEDLLAVKGIGPRLYERLGPLVSVVP